jgi:hypothetical protein
MQAALLAIGICECRPAALPAPRQQAQHRAGPNTTWGLVTSHSSMLQHVVHAMDSSSVSAAACQLACMSASLLALLSQAHSLAAAVLFTCADLLIFLPACLPAVLLTSAVWPQLCQLAAA